MSLPKIDESKCTGCGTCVEVCPVQVLALDEENKKSKLVKPKDCIGCKACAASCPVEAITFDE